MSSAFLRFPRRRPKQRVCTTSLLLLEESREARLFKVMITGESLGDALLSHYNERNTVGNKGFTS